MAVIVKRKFHLHVVDAAFEDAEDATLEVVEDKVVSKDRHGVVHEAVLKELLSGRFYSLLYTPEPDAFNLYRLDANGELFLTEVEPVEVTTIHFRPVQYA